MVSGLLGIRNPGFLSRSSASGLSQNLGQGISQGRVSCEIQLGKDQLPNYSVAVDGTSSPMSPWAGLPLHSELCVLFRLHQHRGAEPAAGNPRVKQRLQALVTNPGATPSPCIGGMEASCHTRYIQLLWWDGSKLPHRLHSSESLNSWKRHLRLLELADHRKPRSVPGLLLVP